MVLFNAHTHTAQHIGAERANHNGELPCVACCQPSRKIISIRKSNLFISSLNRNRKHLTISSTETHMGVWWQRENSVESGDTEYVVHSNSVIPFVYVSRVGACVHNNEITRNRIPNGQIMFLLRGESIELRMRRLCLCDSHSGWYYRWRAYTGTLDRALDDISLYWLSESPMNFTADEFLYLQTGVNQVNAFEK